MSLLLLGHGNHDMRRSSVSLGERTSERASKRAGWLAFVMTGIRLSIYGKGREGKGKSRGARRSDVYAPSVGKTKPSLLKKRFYRPMPPSIYLSIIFRISPPSILPYNITGIVYIFHSQMPTINKKSQSTRKSNNIRTTQLILASIRVSYFIFFTRLMMTALTKSLSPSCSRSSSSTFPVFF